MDEAQRDKGRILFRPTLALAGQGLELMLKASYYLNGATPPTKGREGHNIQPLWDAEICEPIRGAVYVNARLWVSQQGTNEDYPDLPDESEISSLIEEYVVALGRLHGGIDGYALRYPSRSEQDAPRTPFLVGSLWGAADDLVKRPEEFKLQRFSGRI